MAGDQSLLKRINRVALIRLVKAEPGLSRVDLARRTGLTKTTVGMLVQELIDEGWLRQSAPSASPSAGRRPLPLALDPSRIGLLGAEIGVDYLNAVACNLQGQVLWSRMAGYRHRGVARSVRSLAGLVREGQAALRARRLRPLGLAVGVPGMIGPRDGLLRFAPNLGWHGVDLRRALRAALGAGDGARLPVAILNEARASALSEYVFGAEAHAGPLVYLSMGIGIGAGIVLRDRLYLGHDGMAGEVGHTILQPGGPPCACGRRGCAETLVSQRAVSRGATGRSGPILPIAALVERLRRRDRATLRAAAQAGRSLGLLLQHLDNTLDPAVVVLGGPLCQLGEAFLDPALSLLRASAGRYVSPRAKIRLCRFGLNACAVGAAGSVFHGFLRAHEGETPPAPAEAPGGRATPLPRP
ncbi:MAG TPA: ROK family transcriptional regulator [Anaeromyxobacter sp.]|nr:ROK family transcriptional regulator [Anaeromyxobacter sp.]